MRHTVSDCLQVLEDERRVLLDEIARATLSKSATIQIHTFNAARLCLLLNDLAETLWVKHPDVMDTELWDGRKP